MKKHTQPVSTGKEIPQGAADGADDFGGIVRIIRA